LKIFFESPYTPLCGVTSRHRVRLGCGTSGHYTTLLLILPYRSIHAARCASRYQIRPGAPVRQQLYIWCAG